MSLFVNRKILLILSALLITLHALAQSSTYNVTHYTNENGLPQNSIKGLEIDKNGFMWLITESGLLRFDGQKFKLYDRNHFPVMASNRLPYIKLTKDSLIYFIDEHRNAYSFDKQQKIVRLQPRRKDKKTGGISDTDFLDPIAKMDFENKYNVLGEIKGTDESFFLSSPKEVFYLSGEKILWKRHLTDNNNHVLKAAGYLNKKIYYLDKQFKIKSIDRNGIIKKVFLKGINPNLRITNLYPYNYCFFQQAEELYLLLGRGIYQLRESGEQELTCNLVLEVDVPGIYIYRNYPSLNLQVIGSWTHGLYLYRRKQFKALRHTNGFGNFYPQAIYQDSGVLTTRGIVYPSSSKFNYPFDISETYRGLLRDSRGHYWINRGEKREGEPYYVSVLDEHLKIVKNFPTQSEVNCFRETSDGAIWVSAHLGDRLGKCSGNSIKWLSKIWPRQSILTFLPENNEEFWIGGIHTFIKLNVRTGKEQHYKSLEQFTIETLYLDADKILWIGTTGNGFFALKQNKIYELPLDIKNNLSNVHAFMEDKSGFMWMSTNNGLFRCKKEDLKNFIDHKATAVYYQYFSKDSGFNTNEFNGSCTPAAVVLGNGKFSFPSMDGLVQFYPDSIRELLPKSKIFVDKLLVDGKEKDFSTRLTLEPSFKHLEIEVAAPFMGNSANQQIEYNVKGLDRNWYPLKNDNVVTLNNLPYGKYSLQFRKQGGFGSNNIITTALPFTVLPFFYQTWYFRLAILALALVIVFILVKVRYANLMKRNKALEQEVSQRTLHLQSANHLKEKILMMVGHDLQSPLHFLGYLSETNYDALMSRQHKKAGLISQEMKNTTKKIYAFVDEFNLWARVQDEQFNLKKTTFPLTPFVSELQLFFKEILQLNQNALEYTTEGEYELHTNRELLKAVLRNLIDNANKHTHNGSIHIHCNVDDDTCLIRVSDTGKGMSPEVLKKINDLLKRSATINFDSGSRLGYQFIIDFAARLNAHITITSEENKGTSVLISGIALHVAGHKNKKSYPTP